ncbi:hypothetical protein PDIG_73070 [Penicillium digitatum PHI26]|uniref:Uncharacterized protein n=2 Tax=Penicillium digitatum TaxID=36651 RepID=K9G2I5_PEND2|nr:hypothetical protein PDIP_43550 [Penicillium digitatum Pd1]EKV07446.1 hypothetical protein PDIG_73070 [Penicillium digitatum PHI26]EKV14482.1 hypothetical protein PDIP_43550 [Penicillium digitatum Pd1]
MLAGVAGKLWQQAPIQLPRALSPRSAWLFAESVRRDDYCLLYVAQCLLVEYEELFCSDPVCRLFAVRLTDEFMG